MFRRGTRLKAKWWHSSKTVLGGGDGTSTGGTSDVPAVLLVSDGRWRGDALSRGLRERRGLSVGAAAVVVVGGWDGDGADGGLGLNSELQDGCSSEPDAAVGGTFSSRPEAPPSWSLELQHKE